MVHATEDQEKVLASIAQILRIAPDRFTTTPSEGHYKNKILMLEANLSSSEASDLAIVVASKLGSLDRDELERNIDQFSDEKGNLYVRLDKQKICQGKISLSNADSLRIRFKPLKRYRAASQIESYRGLFASE